MVMYNYVYTCMPGFVENEEVFFVCCWHAMSLHAIVYGGPFVPKMGAMKTRARVRKVRLVDAYRKRV